MRPDDELRAKMALSAMSCGGVARECKEQLPKRAERKAEKSNNFEVIFRDALSRSRSAG